MDVDTSHKKINKILDFLHTQIPFTNLIFEKDIYGYPVFSKYKDGKLVQYSTEDYERWFDIDTRYSMLKLNNFPINNQSIIYIYNDKGIRIYVKKI